MAQLEETLSRSLFRGAVDGVAAWGSYALLEFLLSSVVFRLARPYAVFTSWHWSLTAMLLLGYLAAGSICGAAAGGASWLMRRRVRVSVQAAANFTLVFAFGLHIALRGDSTWMWLLPAAALLGAVLLVPRWNQGAGWLTNSWIVAGLLLGLGQELGLREMGAAKQLYSHLGLASIALAIFLVAVVSISFLIGRKFRLPDTVLEYAAIGGAALLLIASFALGRPSGLSVQAASPLLSTMRPNILVIVMDTVVADHLAVYGYGRDTTPNLRALAGDSMVYTNAMSASDITLTSHASLFTGMYPSWHGAYCDPRNAPYGRAMSDQYPTVAELLHTGGYQTTGVAANLYLRSDFGLERGFDRFRIPRPVPMLPSENDFMLRRGMRRGLSLVFDTAQFDRLYARGEEINRELFADLASQAKPGIPAFTFVNYMDAHFPYVPPAPYDARFPGRRPGTTQDDLVAEQQILAWGGGKAPGYRPHCESQYDGGIAYVDQQIGEVVKWLKHNGGYDNTMIVIASDHGEAFGERNRVGHANSPYQNVLHAVLIVKYPRQAHRGTEPRPVSLTDVAPTILEAAGIAVPATMQGHSLTSVTDREIFGETFPCPVAHSPDCPDGCTARVLYSWPYKFISTSNGRRELFDLGNDPTEERNLYIRQPERSAELGDRLLRWMRDMPPQSRETHTLSPEDLRRLKSLGYVQ